MAQEGRRARLVELEPRLVLLFLAIGGPFLLIGSLVILSWLRGEMNRNLGDDFLGGAAADTARYLDTYLLNDLTNVSVIASVPTLRGAVETSNRQYPSDAERIRERLLQWDEEWVEHRGAVPLALDIVGRDTSEFLREVATFNSSYKEILVTDRQGALVAATNITSDYYQADEDWWQQAFGDGEMGALYSSGLVFDGSAGGYALEMAATVRDSADSEAAVVIGVLKVLLEAKELFRVVSAVSLGNTGHALLLNIDDGKVIAGRTSEDVMQRQYEGIASLRDALAESRKSFLSRDQDGNVWVASFARMPEPTPVSYRNWVVLVQQEAREAQAPMTMATVYLIAFFIGIGLLVVLASLYLHWKLVRPIREIDLREEMDRLVAESGAGGKT